MAATCRCRLDRSSGMLAGMSIAWQRCAVRMSLSPIPAACVLAGWVMGTRLGNWAGEWAIVALKASQSRIH